jgi:hypothetical protein
MNPDTPPTDIVDLLRVFNYPLELKAADEIERLREQLRLANIDNFNTTAEVDRLRRAAVELEEQNQKLRVRIEELEGIIDWHIDMVVGDAWLCRIEGKYDDIDRLLGEAVGKEIQAYEIDNPHHEDSFDPANPAAPAA